MPYDPVLRRERINQMAFERGQSMGQGIGAMVNPDRYWFDQNQRLAEFQENKRRNAMLDALRQKEFEQSQATHRFNMIQGGARPASAFAQQGPSVEGPPLTGPIPGTLDLGNGLAYNPDAQFQEKLMQQLEATRRGEELRNQFQSQIADAAMKRRLQERAYEDAMAANQPMIEGGYSYERVPRPAPKGTISPEGSFGYDYRATPIQGLPTDDVQPKFGSGGAGKAEKAPSIEQQKAGNFASRMVLAEKALSQIENNPMEQPSAGKRMAMAATGPAGWIKLASGEFEPSGRARIPEILAVDAMKSQRRKLYEQAGLNAVMSALRAESGATVTPSEIDYMSKLLLVQPGDGDDVKEQKQQTRKIIADSLAKAARGERTGPPDLGDDLANQIIGKYWSEVDSEQAIMSMEEPSGIQVSTGRKISVRPAQ